MLGDFFAGLKAGLFRDPLIWLLLLLNAVAAFAAYGVWFKSSAEQVRRDWAELRSILADETETPAAR